MLLELRRAEAGADEAQEVGVEGEEGAALAEARVEAHAERQQHVFELPVCKGGEAVVVVEREVLDEEGGDEAGAQGVDAEGHGAGEGVPHLLLHDARQGRGVVAVGRVREPFRLVLDFIPRASVSTLCFVAQVERAAHVVVDCGGAQGARAHEVGHGLAPEEPLLLREPHDDCRAALPGERDAEREPVHAAEHGRDVPESLLRVLQHRGCQARAELVLHEVHEVDELLPRVVVDLRGHELVDEVDGERLPFAEARVARFSLPRDARHAARLANSRERAPAFARTRSLPVLQ